ncbi:MAG: HAMP domain-containing protein [Methylococcaceae bacterium]|nr:MAG: HAMP domain-containing protein [Methylococcaceae bacterium]
MKLRWPQTLFGRVGLLFVLVPTLNLIFLMVATVLVVSIPGSRQFALMSSALVIAAEEMADQGDAVFAKLAQRLERETAVHLQRGRAVHDQALPVTPVLSQWQKRLQQTWGDRLELGFQADPEPLLWLQTLHAQPVAVGLPLFIPAGGLGLWWLIVIWLVEGCLAVAVAWWIARHLNQPLLDLAEAAGQLGRDRRAVEINPEGPVEIRALGRALNSMSADIERLSKEQELLLAGISHDLRTPLTRLRLAVEMLHPGQNGHNNASELETGMQADIEEMNAIIHQFIELARCNIEETEPWREGDINLVLGEVRDNYQRAGIYLELVTAALPPVSYKPLALKRLFYNLVDNGLKYGGGRITLSSALEDERVCVKVNDCGAGLPDAVQQRLRESSTSLRAGSSGGLGLIIVQRIAKLHGAALLVRNRAPQGLEVKLLFPDQPPLPG